MLESRSQDWRLYPILGVSIAHATKHIPVLPGILGIFPECPTCVNPKAMVHVDSAGCSCQLFFSLLDVFSLMSVMEELCIFFLGATPAVV